MSAMGQHLLEAVELIEDTQLAHRVEKLNEDEKKAQDQASKPQVFTLIEEEPF
jgi:hypothetical protein